MEIAAPVAVIRNLQPLTPFKQLEQAPSLPSERSEETDGSRRRGITVDDTIKLAFLSAWIEWCEVPFGHNISQNKKKVKPSLDNILE